MQKIAFFAKTLLRLLADFSMPGIKVSITVEVTTAEW